MHKALKLKRVADALAAAGGGWLPLTLKAWRKYVRRKRGKENKPPALPAPPAAAPTHHSTRKTPAAVAAPCRKYMRRRPCRRLEDARCAAR